MTFNLAEISTEKNEKLSQFLKVHISEMPSAI